MLLAAHALAFALLPYTPPPAGPGFEFIDVGQGAALLIRDAAGELVLVDSGPAGAAEAVLAAVLAEQAVGEPARVALWIHGHYDADHLGGFARVVAGLDGVWPSVDDLDVSATWDRGLGGSIPDTDATRLYFALTDGQRTAATAGQVYRSEGLEIRVLALDPPPADAPENAQGLALCVELAGRRALLPGDLPAERLELAAAACGPVDLLWLGHHGSADAISAAAIALADPDLVVISAGLANGYCHPAARALALVGDRRVRILAGAGLDPRGPCAPLAEALGPDHRLLGASLWVAGDLGRWVGDPVRGWVGD